MHPLARMWGGVAPIEIIAEDVGNAVTGVSTANFTLIAVGAEAAGKTLICALTHSSNTSAAVTITSVTVDPGGAAIPMTRVAEGLATDETETHRAAIYVADISAIAGATVTIRVISTGTAEGFGLDAVSLRHLRSLTPTSLSQHQQASGAAITTDAVVSGLAGGFVIGCALNDITGNPATWSSLTEQDQSNTGGSGRDHARTSAWDLLPNGRAAATETVTWSTGTSDTSAIAVAAFR
jgi:hypothetical protein